MWDNPDYVKRAILTILRSNSVPVNLETSYALLYIGIEMLAWGGMEPENVEYMVTKAMKSAFTVGRKDH